MPKKQKSGRSTVLSLENVSLLLRMHAEGRSFGEIGKHFDSQKITHPSSSVMYSMTKSKCHQAEIEAYREDYYARIQDVPISHKRTRLEVRQQLMDSMKKLFKKMLSKDGDIKKRQFKTFMSLAKRLDEILIGAQGEMEKRPGTIIALSQNIGDRGLTMEELLIEEQTVIGRIAELRQKGISLPDRETGDAPEAQEGENT